MDRMSSWDSNKCTADVISCVILLLMVIIIDCMASALVSNNNLDIRMFILYGLYSGCKDGMRLLSINGDLDAVATLTMILCAVHIGIHRLMVWTYTS